MKAHPDKVTFASQGNGSTSHLTAALFESLTGTRMIHVPYKGTAPALTDLLGGQVDVFFDNLLRRCRCTAAAGFGSLPSLTRSAPRCFRKSQPSWRRRVVCHAGGDLVCRGRAPGTPNDMVRALNRVFVDALEAARRTGELCQRGARVVGSTPQQMDRFVREETARWAQVIKAAKITVD